MSTFQAVQDRINGDYLNRDTFVEETKRAIKAAIRHYEYQRWPHNETATDVTATVGQSYIALPSNFLVLDDVPRISVSGFTVELNSATSRAIRDMLSAAVNGQPTHYSYYQNRLNIFAPPDSAYAVTVPYLKRLTELSAGGDTNAWITGGWEDVIAYHATKLMWSNVLRNDKNASKFGVLERSALDAMREQEHQNMRGRVTPTQF